MSAQWQGLLQNLGTWEGSFLSLSPTGEKIQDTPSQVTLTQSTEDTIDFCLRRCPANAPVQETPLRFTYPGPGRNIPFFPGGAFSQGTLQWSHYSQCGAELAMIWGDRRLRLVLMFAASPQLSQLTLIQECRAGSGVTASAALQITDLVGYWQGQAHTLYADGKDPEKISTHLRVEISGQVLHQTLNMGEYTLKTAGQIAGSCITFGEGSQPRNLLLLPGGASCLCPQSIVSGQAFFLEAGWLIEANLRQRFMRSYSDRGEWVSLTLVTERRIL
ncbi:DUF3598 family protein [Synechococcales cyanobacterium C]|uniref:DUF3598 family protein n=1 Tax=Petrachloros mirabilis ULC683 TaxID=2781853 RepID=A0A8K2A296_9CYAN|nr:DUF3598 family protein [Petrachloros mirabilis]NCJ08252.1 DUF3598 family protein [Petrachloros mirabilis ULC683]